MREGGKVSASTFGVGDAGGITIKALGTISADRGGLFSTVEQFGEGKSGGINITTGSLKVLNGGRVNASTAGEGKAGKITINAGGDVSLDGQFSAVLSNVEETATGDSGGVTIMADSLSLTKGGLIESRTRGNGNTADIDIQAPDGTITIDGANSSFPFNSGIYSRVENTANGNAGNISITTGSLKVLNSGRVNASTAGEGKAGKITINASGTISADGDRDGNPSGILSQVEKSGVGNAGGINLTTTNLSLIQGGVVAADTFGQGNAGEININASGTISAEGEDSLRFSSGIFSRVIGDAVGNSGGINITTTNLSLTQGGRVDNNTSGVGNAGEININASGTISADGETPSGFFDSGIFSTVEKSGVGNAGGINITTTNLSLTQGGLVSASTFGQGDAGAITIKASETISINGKGQDGFLSGLFSTVINTAIGNSDGINITTTDLFLTQGAIVNASTFGQGNAGVITIKALETISAEGGGILSKVESNAVGNAGGIDITTTDLLLTQGGQVDASTFGQGDAGGINITTTDLLLTQGGQVVASTFRQGDAGDITINASGGTISADGESPDKIPSGIFSTVEGSGVGDSGGINLTTANLFLTQGGTVNATTFGEGNAGGIKIDASKTISAQGEDRDGIPSGIFSQVGEVGNAGGIDITTTDLFLTQGGRVDASTFGQGNAGAITINASDTVSAQGEARKGFNSGIFSTVESTGEGNSGGINITTTDLSLREGGVVNASTFGEGNAGAITIKARGTISADGEDSEGFNSGIFSTVESTGEGNSGGINITTTDLSLREGGVVNANTFGEGNAGDIKIDTLNLSIDRDSSISALTTASGDSGTITINAPQSVQLTNNSQLTVETSGAGKPGNIFITTPNLTIGKDSQLSATATESSTNTEGTGSITINTSNLDLTGKLGIFINFYYR